LALKDRRKAYEEKIDTQKDEGNAMMVAKTKSEYNKAIETLQHRQNEAETKLYELKSIGHETWEDLKTDARKTWDEAKAAFHRAASKFN
jgi:predicted  nucleic acid-binding Zn-ribbon protein